MADEVCGLLCGQERARAERLLSAEGRQLWMRSRGVLRTLLGRYMRRDARTLRFAIGAHGKPTLLQDAAARTAREAEAIPEAPGRLSFNLSHSDDLAVYAFTTLPSVGVDVERARRPINAVGIAARTFGATEAARLRQLDPQTREREFLRAWVRHEAELKCLGVGIGGARALGSEPRAWIADLEVGPGTPGAVAVQAEPRELRCLEWDV